MRGDREKLALAGGYERHAVVGVTMASSWATFHALHHDANTLPPAPPRLPAEFTHLWLIGAGIRPLPGLVPRSRVVRAPSVLGNTGRPVRIARLHEA
jgi:hypothetical protein